ncbi:MAG: zinc-ribbon domain-containing protein [Faecousia sp.]
MFCPNCGNELPNEAKFCAVCGVAVQLNEQPCFEANIQAREGTATGGTTGKIRKGRIPLFIVMGIALMAVVILVLSLNSKTVKLKYAWGTDFEIIERKEGDSVYHSDKDRYEYDHINVRDEDHEVDRLKELNINSEGVRYILKDGKLLRTIYEFSNDYSYEEAVEIIAGYYGDDYYERGSKCIWWKDGTVVRLDMYDRSIIYVDEKDYLEADNYYDRYAIQDIMDFFGKEFVEK